MRKLAWFVLVPALLAGAALALLNTASAHQSSTAPAVKSALPPIDPQQVEDQDKMTWDDYHPIPGHNWADPALKPQRAFHLALIAIDYPDFPFRITLPKKSDPFGNPQVDPVPRDKVPQYYADFWSKPSAVNHGQTINGFWMEQSRGKFGITDITPFGPYRMPHPEWFYGLSEYRSQQNQTPDGSIANGNLDRDCDALWRADVGDAVADDPKWTTRTSGAKLRIYAGYDETGVWQEFGEMKFNTKEDITPEFGNPNPAKPRWVGSRYVEWTSWLAGSQHWGVSSIHQGENSGTITHELGHFAFSIGDLNNNPYVTPYRRVAVGPWDIMDRGSFNGPGGPHNRWEVPANMGADMPAGFMLRNRLKNEFITQDQLVMLNRDGLSSSGLAVVNVTARCVDPLPNSYAGVTVTLDGKGDRTPVEDPATHPLSPGTPNYNFYSMEIVQRLGYDSFTPDNGVLIAKNKDGQGGNGGPNGFSSFIWLIDAHPEDINMVDYVKPNGTKVMRTIADYRQTNDAAFHAGLNSGSQYEYVDTPNRLHFYVIDIQKNAEGILSYTLGVRSLDGAGPQKRGVALSAPAAAPTASAPNTKCAFTLKNTGTAAATNPKLHWRDFNANLTSDIYRLSVSVQGQGWTAQLQNALAAVKFGESASVPVFVTHAPGSAATATVTIKATSESDPTKTATATCQVSG